MLALRQIRVALSVACFAITYACASLPGAYYAAKKHYDDREFAQALPLLRDLVRAGDQRAMVLLAQMYIFGEGVTPDSAQARELLTQAAEKGDAHAQYLLSGYYLGGPGHPNPVAGFELLMRAARQGHALAQADVGQAYLAGLGTSKDICQGLLWLKKAAAQGEARAQSLLAQTDGSACAAGQTRQSDR